MTFIVDKAYERILDLLQGSTFDRAFIKYYPFCKTGNELSTELTLDQTKMKKIIKYMGEPAQTKNYEEVSYRDIYAIRDESKTRYFKKQEYKVMDVEFPDHTRGLLMLELESTCDEFDLPSIAEYHCTSCYQINYYQFDDMTAEQVTTQDNEYFDLVGELEFDNDVITRHTLEEALCDINDTLVNFERRIDRSKPDTKKREKKINLRSKR